MAIKAEFVIVSKIIQNKMFENLTQIYKTEVVVRFEENCTNLHCGSNKYNEGKHDTKLQF